MVSKVFHPGTGDALYPTELAPALASKSPFTRRLVPSIEVLKWHRGSSRSKKAFIAGSGSGLHEKFLISRSDWRGTRGTHGFN
jgi:hypothetical protein